jgi:autophagy-related protein 13
MHDSPPSSNPEVEILSNVYKRCIPVFRSIYTMCGILPAAKIAKLNKHSNGLKLRYRIGRGRVPFSKSFELDAPLYPDQQNVTSRFDFGSLQCSAGTLQASVTYRSECVFRVDDSESLLSSHFMVQDDNLFKPTLAGRHTEPGQVPGSAPSRRGLMEQAAVHEQTYGSLSTFHNAIPGPSTSPISALRAMAEPGSSRDSAPQRVPTNQRSSHISRPSLSGPDSGIPSQRRPSISWQPFKAGSLASSPASGHMPLSPSGSVGRPSPFNPMTHRSRNSITTLPQVALRTPTMPSETAVASSTSSSPKPAPINRYSSSFSHRRSRFSSGASKGDDDNNSSGKASATSSAQPGSDVLNEARGEGTGSGSGSGPGPGQQNDDENLKDFLRLLESKKDLKSFSKNDHAARESSMRRTQAQLSKYQRMRDSTAVLSDSISSSLVLPRSTSSSRQISSVPPMIGGASVSTASSPGKPISPHTPHTPAIPSRLSATSITVDYGDRGQAPRRSRSEGRRREEVETTNEDDSSDTTTRTDTGTNAIDIPTSPRQWAYRRSSSVSQGQQHRSIEDEQDPIFRSASLPAEERTDLDLELHRAEAIASLRPDTAHEKTSRHTSSEDQSPSASASVARARVYSVTPDPQPTSSRSRHSRGNISRRGSSSHLPSYSMASSSGGPSTVHPLDRVAAERGGFGERGGAHYSPSQRNSTVAPDEDDGLLFTMSELGAGAAASRRSLEESGRGGPANIDRRGGRGSGNPTQGRHGGWH